MYDDPIQDHSSLENAVKSYLFYNLLTYRTKYYEAWEWDPKIVERGKAFVERFYTPQILSYATISHSGLLKCVLHFSVEIPFKDEQYAVVFTTFHPHREKEFMAIKNEHAMDTKFIGFAFLAFRMNNGNWEMVNQLDGFRGLSQIAYSVRSNRLNFTWTVKQSNVKGFLENALIPEHVKENILNVD
ncbi:MAG: hypothetical protein JJU29_16215 [Verrucomicrobia bacterium]|nr:hypothetical protein [Verrucomicrobiota bacterium]MCH8513597.1 hypothetical protein [Kiritimatiellia bacterium]